MKTKIIVVGFVVLLVLAFKYSDGGIFTTANAVENKVLRKSVKTKTIKLRCTNRFRWQKTKDCTKRRGIRRRFVVRRKIAQANSRVFRVRSVKIKHAGRYQRILRRIK